MEDGKRLENMSWRLWSRQTVCRAPSSLNPPGPKQLLLGRSTEAPSKSSLALPELSSSVESRISSVDTPSTKAQTRQLMEGRHLSQLRVKDADKHYTPIDLQRIVKSIKEKQMSVESVAMLSRSLSNHHALTADRARSQRTTPRPRTERYLPAPNSSVSTISTTATSNASGNSLRHPSKDSTSTEISSHGVVRGFSVGCTSSSYRSQTQCTPQLDQFPKQTAQMSADMAKKKAARFVIGCSSDEGGESSSEANTFQPHSYLSEELKKSGPVKKQMTLQGGAAPAKPVIDRSYESEDVFESGDEEDGDEDEVSESAIDDDDEDAWEDSDTEDGRAAALDEKHLFQRVDSRANLTSRRSLLTTMMHEKDRKQELASAAALRSPSLLRRSRTTSPNGPSLATSPDEDAVMVKVTGRPIPQPKPIIMTTSNLHAPPYSPRTTRRNMLTTELTESLRKHILWERQQKNVTANAALKRRHTSHDVKNLRQYPKGQYRESLLEKKEEASKTNSWNHYFDNGLQEYHQKGW